MLQSITISLLQGNGMQDKNDTKTIDVFKKVAKTNAERQREYRQRNRLALNSDGAKRLDMYISEESAINLDCLVEYFSLRGNVTKKQLIERLINDERMRYLHEIGDMILKDK